MVFFLSQTDHAAQVRFLTAVDRSPAREPMSAPLRPALDGLGHVIAGGTFGDDGHAGTGPSPARMGS